jgi:hypothetical protein
MRLVCGTNGTLPLAVAKNSEGRGGVGVDRRIDARAGAVRHALIEGFVWQFVTASGRFVKASRKAAVSECDVLASDDPPFPSRRFGPGQPLRLDRAERSLFSSLRVLRAIALSEIHRVQQLRRYCCSAGTKSMGKEIRAIHV